MEDKLLEKTNRINLLYDFYRQMLTEKQQLFLEYYYLDDYSLGEIAAEFSISRQAVYEHIKRAAKLLEDYEDKLQLLAKHDQRMLQLKEMEFALARLPEAYKPELQSAIDKLRDLN
ncbi:YlxM family DNA-binding protein [Ferviditalea candida]|uniref:UPF0122 protein VF724_05910 n=1 Tax=Ferviditalea candida TaxID=3108399 RepID=A0ABU5ZIP7_9BACL|nr:YlxM family DNA-binding protein [Paenibacillaceae bacterium T2]